MTKPTGKLAFAYRTIAMQEDRIEQLEAELARAQLPAGGAVPYTLTEQAPFVIRDAQGRYVAELLAWDAELIGAMLAAAAPHPVSGEQKAECKCSIRTKAVGDGCSVCNPELATEYAKAAAEDDQRERDAVAMRARVMAAAEKLATKLRM